MPILDITLLSGRTADKKQRLIQEVTDATVRALDVPPDSVRVILREVHPSHFAVGGVPKGPAEDGQ
jgi:4-oxalocrotonate tautomerase